jgi:hypothetical protein
MNAGLEIVAEEIAAAYCNADGRIARDDIQEALRDLVGQLIAQLPMGVRGFDADAFRAKCAVDHD